MNRSRKKVADSFDDIKDFNKSAQIYSFFADLNIIIKFAGIIHQNNPNIMKTRIQFLISLVISSASLCIARTSSQEFANDSTPGYTDLKDIVVEGDRLIKTPNSVTVLPTKTEKNASVDAFDLVKRLTLPKITVRDSSVSTLLGDDVAVFINGIPASTDEMRGIDVSTISKVEYLDFPQDSRYLGCQHVLNITTKLPIAGGFTKIYARGDYADKLTEYANIMSKFSTSA